MNLQLLKEFLGNALTAEFLASEVSEVMINVHQGKYALNEKLGHGYLVRDLRACPGFWMLPALIDDCIASYIGRYARMAAQNLGIDLSKVTIPETAALMHTTDAVQRAALEPALKILQDKLGTVELDSKKVDVLLNKVFGSQQYADREINKHTQH